MTRGNERHPQGLSIQIFLYESDPFTNLLGARNQAEQLALATVSGGLPPQKAGIVQRHEIAHVSQDPSPEGYFGVQLYSYTLGLGPIKLTLRYVNAYYCRTSHDILTSVEATRILLAPDNPSLSDYLQAIFGLHFHR